MSVQHTCRICLEPGDGLLSVCKCSGTSKWVHKECIERWFSIRQERTCEVCHGDYDFSQFSEVLNMNTQPHNTRSAMSPACSDSLTRIAMCMSAVVSVSQSVAAWCAIQYNANPVLDVISMGFWFNTIHIILWCGQIARNLYPFSVSIVWLIGTVVPFSFLQIIQDTFDSEASIFFIEINILLSLMGTLCGVCFD